MRAPERDSRADAVGTGATKPGTQTQIGNPNIISGIVLSLNSNAINYDYPGKDFTDLMKGVDEVIGRGYIDSHIT